MRERTKRERTIALVRRWFEGVWNEREPALIDEILAPQSVCYSDQGPIIGPENFREFMYEPFVAAFPDLHVTIDDILADDDQAVVRWTATGTHSGDGMGMTASGKPLAFHGMTWIRVNGDTFDEGWQSTDIPQVLQQLATPA